MPTTLAEYAGCLNLRHTNGAHLPPLILVTDGRRLPDPVGALRQLRPGDAVLLRHYGDPQRRELAFALANRCRASHYRLIVGRDVELARAVGADGVHFPQDLAARGVGPAKAAGFLVTMAAHDEPALIAAGQLQVDAALVSPVFETASHPGTQPLGVHRFAALVRKSSVPVYALGGVSTPTASRLRHSGAVGIAAVGAFSV